MILALSRDSHIIGTSMFRISRWSKEFQFDKESTHIAVWIRLPHLPFIYFHSSYLERLGNTIVNFIRVDDKTVNLQNLVYARLCVEIDVTGPRPSRVWIGESKEKGYWHKIEYEGNNAFCTHCGLLGHVKGDCRKAANIGGSKDIPKTSSQTDGFVTILRKDQHLKPKVNPKAPQTWKQMESRKGTRNEEHAVENIGVKNSDVPGHQPTTNLEAAKVRQKKATDVRNYGLNVPIGREVLGVHCITD